MNCEYSEIPLSLRTTNSTWRAGDRTPASALQGRRHKQGMDGWMDGWIDCTLIIYLRVTTMWTDHKCDYIRQVSVGFLVEST
jgi:hypothetical protein